MEDIVLIVEADVNPTESEEKVKKALENLFGAIPMQTKTSGKSSIVSSELKGRPALFEFRNLLRRDRIRDAARKALFRETKGNTIKFCLNKQVALAGHVSFSEENSESPLGPIRVTIKCSDSQELINWLAPRIAYRE